MYPAYKLLVFDWEGTLADTLGQLFHTISQESEALGFGKVDFNLARHYVDLGLVAAIKKLFPHLSNQNQDELFQHVQQAMTAKSTKKYLIPGTEPFINQLQKANIDIAIATNKSHQSLQRALQTTKLDEKIKITRTASQAAAKPDPQMLFEIMDIFNIDPQSTLMIGDSISDIEMAKNAGVNAVGVDFYHQQEQALKEAGAIEVFDDYKKLAHFLGINNS